MSPWPSGPPSGLGSLLVRARRHQGPGSRAARAGSHAAGVLRRARWRPGGVLHRAGVDGAGRLTEARGGVDRPVAAVRLSQHGCGVAPLGRDAPRRGRLRGGLAEQRGQGRALGRALQLHPPGAGDRLRCRRPVQQPAVHPVLRPDGPHPGLGRQPPRPAAAGTLASDPAFDGPASDPGPDGDHHGVRRAGEAPGATTGGTAWASGSR